MVAGLPDRPLSMTEALAIDSDDPYLLAIPAALESIRYNENDETRFYDLILFGETFTAAISYIESDEEWRVIAKKDGDAFEEVHQIIVDYHDYESTTETMREIFLDSIASLIARGEFDKDELERQLQSFEKES